MTNTTDTDSATDVSGTNAHMLRMSELMADGKSFPEAAEIAIVEARAEAPRAVYKAAESLLKTIKIGDVGSLSFRDGELSFSVTLDADTTAQIALAAGGASFDGHRDVDGNFIARKPKAASSADRDRNADDVRKYAETFLNTACNSGKGKAHLLRDKENMQVSGFLSPRQLVYVAWRIDNQDAARTEIVAALSEFNKADVSNSTFDNARKKFADTRFAKHGITESVVIDKLIDDVEIPETLDELDELASII